jgi:hypothetical protein
MYKYNFQNMSISISYIFYKKVERYDISSKEQFEIFTYLSQKFEGGEKELWQ